MSCLARVAQFEICPGLTEFPDGFCKLHHNKDLYLQRTYGISLLDCFQILDYQQWKCPVTRDELHEGTWVVDHSHRLKRVRGMLSRYANHRIVGRHEDWEILWYASQYLKDPPAWRILPDQKVPAKKRKRRKKKPS